MAVALLARVISSLLMCQFLLIITRTHLVLAKVFVSFMHRVLVTQLALEILPFLVEVRVVILARLLFYALGLLVFRLILLILIML